MSDKEVLINSQALELHVERLREIRKNVLRLYDALKRLETQQDDSRCFLLRRRVGELRDMTLKLCETMEEFLDSVKDMIYVNKKLLEKTQEEIEETLQSLM